MKRSVKVLAGLVITLSLIATAYAGHEHMVIPYEGTFGHYETMPHPAAGDLRHHITSHMPYKKWSLWPGKGEMYKGTEPHGALLTIYVNEEARKSIGKKGGFANNSIVLKENYSPDKKLAAVTVMYKVKGYNPEGGNWFWVKYGPDFKILKEGKVKGCLGCHGAAKDNDYVFTGR